MVAAAKGYKCIIVMPQVPSMYERYILVRKFGCEVHLTSVLQDDFPKTPVALEDVMKIYSSRPEATATRPQYTGGRGV